MFYICREENMITFSCMFSVYQVTWQILVFRVRLNDFVGMYGIYNWFSTDTLGPKSHIYMIRPDYPTILNTTSDKG